MCADGGQDAGNAEGFFGVGGTEECKDDVVEVRSGVALTKDGAATSYNDAISIRLNCSENPHVVQFIYREILGANGQPKRRRVKTAAGAYDTTTNPDHPVWNTDSAAKPEPYYEASGASHAGPGWLAVYDQPSVTPGAGETWRATFKTYLICNGDVFREVMWMRSQEDGQSPRYSVTVTRTDGLPDWVEKQLKDRGYRAVS